VLRARGQGRSGSITPGPGQSGYARADRAIPEALGLNLHLHQGPQAILPLQPLKRQLGCQALHQPALSATFVRIPGGTPIEVGRQATSALFIGVQGSGALPAPKAAATAPPIGPRLEHRRLFVAAQRSGSQLEAEQGKRVSSGLALGRPPCSPSLASSPREPRFEATHYRGPGCFLINYKTRYRQKLAACRDSQQCPLATGSAC